MIKYSRTQFEHKVRILKALSHPARLWIVEVLKEKPLCVCEFVSATGNSFPSVSRHLHILKKAGILEDEKQGQKVYYRLKMRCALDFIECAERCRKSDTESQGA